MNLINGILNLVGLFLWVDWRTGRVTSQVRPVISLVGALRETNRRASRGWTSLLGLVALLLVRPFFYQRIGSALNWTPVTDLPAISLAWRSDLLDRMFVYSTVSFLLVLGYYYFCLLIVSASNAGTPETEVMRRFVRSQLGWLARLHWSLKVLLPFIVIAVAWAATVPLLVSLGIMPKIPPVPVLWAQAGIFSLASILAWKWFFGALFFLHAINSYVYLGTHPFLGFMAAVGARLLRPLAFLRWGKLDIAPFMAIGLVFAFAELLVRPLVLRLLARVFV